MPKRKHHGKKRHGGQRGMVALAATEASPQASEETDDFHELIVAFTRESEQFTSLKYNSRARKLAEKMLELFLDFRKIPAAKAAGVRERIRQLFAQAIIELRYGRFMGEADIQQAREGVETALRAAVELAKTQQSAAS